MGRLDGKAALIVGDGAAGLYGVCRGRRHGFVDFIAREFHAGKMMFPPDAS